MCAQYTMLTEEEVLEMRDIIADVQRQMYAEQKLSTTDARPSQIVPVVTRAGPRPMKWGFPGFGGKGLVINARVETAAEKNMFRDAVVSRRCALPTTGFYEWGAAPDAQLSLIPDGAASKQRGTKDKYLFSLPDQTMFYLAGVYNVYLLAGVQYPHFVVLTTDANSSVSVVHDRMPVVLQCNELHAWLDTGLTGDTTLTLARRKVG